MRVAGSVHWVVEPNQAWAQASSKKTVCQVQSPRLLKKSTRTTMVPPFQRKETFLTCSNY
eukprot:5812298-Amphidinium_carterae.1